MINISKPYASLLLMALSDAIRHNENLLNSETIKGKDEIEEYLLCVTTMYGEIKRQYMKIEGELGITINELGDRII